MIAANKKDLLIFGSIGLAIIALFYLLYKKGNVLTSLIISSAWLTPVIGRFTSGFGMRNGSFHNGIDIAAPTGTPIKAPIDGKVHSRFTSDRGGNSLILMHAQTGHTTGYAHLSAFNVKVGDEVKKGDVIGLVGNTGVSTGPHLHFTVKHNGNYIDPLTVVKV
jgi:murein DD-endopeptidase MepM/ murein hydrolase activator NlpD